jgi:SAM-dependent methyltransferase
VTRLPSHPHHRTNESAELFDRTVAHFLQHVGRQVDYANLAETPSPELPRYIKTFDWLRRNLRESASAEPLRVCDLGGYLGLVGGAISQLGYVVDLVDDYRSVPADSLTALQSWWSDRGMTAHSVDLQHPALRLPFTDATFDVVTLLAVVEHFASSPRIVLEEAHRILRPGGHIVIDTPHAGALGVRLGFLLHGEGLWSSIDDFYLSELPFWGHKRCYSRRELEWILQMASFEVKEVQLFELAGNRHRRSLKATIFYEYLAPLLLRVVRDLHSYVWIVAARSPGPREPSPSTQHG